MLQTIVRAYPPNFEAILKRFPVAINKGVFFSYGDKIYNPSGVPITKQLRAHEAEHGRRQIIIGVEQWWDRYINEPRFLLDEEIYAHHAEWRTALRTIGPGVMRSIAGRLSGPLYGNMIKYETAVEAIQTGVVA